MTLADEHIGAKMLPERVVIELCTMQVNQSMCSLMPLIHLAALVIQHKLTFCIAYCESRLTLHPNMISYMSGSLVHHLIASLT